MILRANVKVTRTFSTRKLDNLAMLGARSLKLRRDVGPHQLVKLRAKVMVKVSMTFSIKKLRIWQCLRLDPLNLDGMLLT